MDSQLHISILFALNYYYPRCSTSSKFQMSGGFDFRSWTSTHRGCHKYFKASGLKDLFCYQKLSLLYLELENETRNIADSYRIDIKLCFCLDWMRISNDLLERRPLYQQPRFVFTDVVTADPPHCLCPADVITSCDVQCYSRNSHLILSISAILYRQARWPHSQRYQIIELTSAGVAFPLLSLPCNSFRCTGQL